MNIHIHKPCPETITFLTESGFIDGEIIFPNVRTFILPKDWKIKTLDPENTTGFLLDPACNIRAELLQLECGTGEYLLIPRTAYSIINTPGIAHPFLIVSNLKRRSTLILQFMKTLEQATNWLDDAYPGWRDPIKYW